MCVCLCECVCISVCVYTGQSGWGIAWYVNGTLIPELVLERGQMYTFIIEGGNNEQDLANYHPFYITSSKNGGRIRNTEAQRNVRPDHSCGVHYMEGNVSRHL